MDRGAAPFDDDLPEPSPPDAQRVARRTLVLAAVACRANLENESDPDAAAFHARLLEWCRAVPRLIDEFEPDEWALVAADLGSLTERQRVDASWRAEGLGVPRR